MPPRISTAADGRFLFDSESARFLMDAPEYARFTLETKCGLNAVSLPAGMGDVSESAALISRRRPHTAEDGSEVALEAENPVPFGAKPVVERFFRFDENSLSISTAFRLSGAFPMDSIDAGGFIFSGGIEQIAITPFPVRNSVLPAEELRAMKEIPDGGILYDSPAPPLRMRLTTQGEKGMLELETGADFWRWENAARLSGFSRCTITRKGGTLIFAHSLYQFTLPPDGDPGITPPPGRNWNLSSRLIFRVPETGKTPYRDVFDAAAFPWPESALASGPDGEKSSSVCFASDAALAILKKWVRRHFADAQESGGKGEGPAVFAIVNASAGHCCHSASHRHRSKRGALRHWDAPALSEFAHWANRQLARCGASLEIVP